VTSFVSPKWIPQLADADALVKALEARPGVRFSALCPEPDRPRAREGATHPHEIAVFISASETHNKKNVNKTIDATLATYRDTIGGAIAAKMKVRATCRRVWGCPYEARSTRRARSPSRSSSSISGCYQVSLGDTIGVGTPRQTKAILERVLGEIAAPKIRDAHARHARHGARERPRRSRARHPRLRRRRRRARRLPVRARSRGQCATEDLVYMLQGMGIESGVDLERLVEAGRAAESIVGRKLPGKVHQSGVRSLRA